MVEEKEEEKVKKDRKGWILDDYVNDLPTDFKAYINKSLPSRRLGAFIFVILVLFGAYPLFQIAGQTERHPFKTFPEHQKFPFNITISISYTNVSIKDELYGIKDELLELLNNGEVVSPLKLGWSFRDGGVVNEVQTRQPFVLDSSSPLEVKVLLIPSESWTFFSADEVRMSKREWVLVQWKSSEPKKMIDNLEELARNVLVDVPHLNVIVRRDLKQKLQPWQIAALPVAHQKRLVWDSAPLAMNYLVQVIHVHDNTSPSDLKTPSVVDILEVFARKVAHITKIEVTSEHLWDFGLNSYVELDVQQRVTLNHDGLEKIIKDVDEQMHTIESTHALFKIVVLESEEHIIMLDEEDEDSRGVAVASWGAVVARSPQTNSRVIASLRVLLGIDADLGHSWSHESVPLAGWEINRMRLRASLDNAMRAVSAVKTLKVLCEDVSTIAIEKSVADWATEAVELVNEAFSDPNSPPLKKLTDARILADKAIYHPSLLSRLYFPEDQKVAVYLPIVLPLFISFSTSIYQLKRWLILHFLGPRGEKILYMTLLFIISTLVMFKLNHFRQHVLTELKPSNFTF